LSQRGDRRPWLWKHPPRHVRVGAFAGASSAQATLHEAAFPLRPVEPIVAKLRRPIEVVDLAPARHTAGVTNDSPRLLDQAPPGGLETKTQIHILKVHEKALVEAPNRSKCLGPDQHAGGRIPGGSNHTRQPTGKRAMRPGLRLERVARLLQNLTNEPTRRGPGELTLAIRVPQSRCDQTDIGATAELCREQVEGSNQASALSSSSASPLAFAAARLLAAANPRFSSCGSTSTPGNRSRTSDRESSRDALSTNSTSAPDPSRLSRQRRRWASPS